MKIISFFSFKGGVGRTALLTNLGAYWAAQGKVVLLMDLDLAAPGLSYSLPGRMLDDQGRGQGMADLLAAFFEGIKKDPDNISFLPPQYLIRAVDIQAPYFQGAAGNLFFIPAGQRPLSADQWGEGLPGESLIPPIPGTAPEKDESQKQTASRALAHYLKEYLQNWTVPDGPAQGKKIDYLLIDTRTGFAELLDLSLGYLAGQMVLVFSLNEQNLRGLKMTLDALETKRVPVGTFPLQVTVVFSPLPAAEDVQLFQRLEKGQQLIAQSLRFDRSGQRELPPARFTIHYNQVLANQESLMVLEFPKSLYSREVTAIAHHLEGKTDADDLQDDLIKATWRRVTRIIGKPEKGENGPLPVEVLPVIDNPFTDLPPWYWPLSPVDREETRRNAILDELIPVSPAVDMNRELMANQLCWSVSLSTEEKQKIMQGLPQLSQYQVDSLMEIFDEERLKYMTMFRDVSEFNAHLINLLLDYQRQWAVLLLKDEKAGNAGFFGALDEHLFPHLEKQAVYWLTLAEMAITQGKEGAPRAEAAYRKAIALDEKDASPWNNLGNLLKDHLGRYEEAESAYRKAIDLDEKFAYPWNGLGNLLQDHLGRYEEAEAAFRKAIALDEKLAYPWNGLGNLLKDHLGRYEEAEAAYRKAIELDEKYALPWYNLGNLLKNHLGRYEEAEAAYRKAIALDEKFAYPWNSLGNLLRDFHLDCGGAMTAFENGLKLNKDTTNAYLHMNLGRTHLLLGQEDPARQHLHAALAEFARQKDYAVNALLLAMQLDDQEKIRLLRPQAEKKAAGSDSYSAYALLFLDLAENNEAAGQYKQQAWDMMKNYDHHFELLKELYYLAGLRPEMRPWAARLVAELLTFPPGLVKRFSDRPRPDSWYDRYRPFAAGQSRGAGDPKDRRLFCRKVKK